MQTAAKFSLVLTDFSSFERLAGLQKDISHGGFYQQIISELGKGIDTNQALGALGERLVLLAEHAHAFRQMDALGRVSQSLMDWPLPRQYEAIGEYYQALCVQRLGHGDAERATSLLKRLVENVQPKYKVRAMISLGANSRNQGDNKSALPLYSEAGRFASRNNLKDPYSSITIQRMFAVIASEDGNHRGALDLLKNLFPLAYSMRSSQPHVYYDYMNSLAVELCELGRLEEARNVSRIALASPFAPAYPEWRETSEEIELRGWRPSRSTVAVTQIAAVTQEPNEIKNLVTLPTAWRDSPAPEPTAESHPPARVIKFPSRIPSMSEQNDKEQLDPSQKRRLVADKLYEMFMASLEDGPIDVELVEKLWSVYLDSRKKKPSDA